ncbi:hypothetical protein RhiJN_08085 [Ceratobasidium sp. AG-Ba]|nr:hypothetical protein RhiJN_08085 [Ceratobasidium sp. AG-Ba]
MSIFLVTLLLLLVTGHLAVADILPLFIILPLLIPSAVVVCGHVYAYSFQFTRDVVALYERYETMNFYQPGYKVLDERYLVACYQIAVEELVLKLRGWYQGLSRGGGIPNSSINSFIPFCLSRFLVVVSVAYLVGCAFSAALRGLVVEVVKLVFYALAATISGLVLVFVFVLIFVSGLVGLCRAMNIGLSDVVAHVAHLSFDERTPSPRACISSACGAYFAVRLVRYAATWSSRTWAAALACALVAAGFVWVYPNRGRLSRCFIKMIASVGRSGGCEMYDQEYDWPVDPTLVAPSPHGLESEEDRLPAGHEEVSRVPGKRPRKHVGYGRFSAGFGYVIGFRPEVHSVERRVKSLTPRGHNGPLSRVKLHSQPACNSTPSFSTSSSYTNESPTIEANPEPSNLVRAEDIHPDFEQDHGSPLAPVISTSPAPSNESLPDLVYDSSASSGSLSEVGTPVRGSGLVALHRPVTSRISSLCLSHQHVGRGQPRFSPLDAPKPVLEARAATGESKAVALLHRSEWKQKAKLRRSRNVVHGSAESSVDLVDSPMDDVVEMVQPDVVLESASTQQWIDADVVLDSPSASAPVDVFLGSSPMGSLLDDLDAQDDAAMAGPVRTRVIKPVPRLRRRMLAARSNRTDAPLMTNVARARSLGTSTGSSLPPKSTGLEDPMSFRSDQDTLRNTSISDSSFTPLSSSTPITTSAAEWVRARRACKAAAAQPVPAEDLSPNLGSSFNSTPINGLDILAALATAARPTTPVTDILVPQGASLAIDPSLNHDLACTASHVPALQTRPVDVTVSSSNPLDVLASLAAAAASSDATAMTPQNLHADTNTNPTREGIPKVRVVPIYTWLMVDGTKRVMKKGECIPPRAQYTIKDGKGTRMMTVGRKPLRV